MSDEARARIAELEDALGGARHVQSEMDARIAELEAERDYHRTAHDSAIARIAQLTISLGEAYAYRSEDHGPAKKPVR